MGLSADLNVIFNYFTKKRMAFTPGIRRIEVRGIVERPEVYHLPGIRSGCFASRDAILIWK